MHDIHAWRWPAAANSEKISSRTSRAFAPDAVFTVRAYGTQPLDDRRLVRNFSRLTRQNHSSARREQDQISEVAEVRSDVRIFATDRGRWLVRRLGWLTLRESALCVPAWRSPGPGRCGSPSVGQRVRYRRCTSWRPHGGVRRDALRAPDEQAGT
jgi:hypothetical protein